MQCSSSAKPRMSVFVLSVLVFLIALATVLVATPPPAVEAKVERVVFGSAGFTESNRFWTIARPEHLQYDPFLETLLDIDPKTGAFTPTIPPEPKSWGWPLNTFPSVESRQIGRCPACHHPASLPSAAPPVAPPLLCAAARVQPSAPTAGPPQPV